VHDTDKLVVKLTQTLVKKCSGQGAVIVVGAGLNLVVTATKLIPDAGLKLKVATLLRGVADHLVSDTITHSTTTQPQ
jgi:hypothetical protein